MAEVSLSLYSLDRSSSLGYCAQRQVVRMNNYQASRTE